jgi:hypothetical protein
MDAETHAHILSHTYTRTHTLTHAHAHTILFISHAPTTHTHSLCTAIILPISHSPIVRTPSCTLHRTQPHHLPPHSVYHLINTQGDLPERVRPDESSWIIGDNNSVEIMLQKMKEGWWSSLVVGDKEIDLDLIEGSKYLDDSLLKKVKEAKLQRQAQETAGEPAPAQ